MVGLKYFLIYVNLIQSENYEPSLLSKNEAHTSQSIDTTKVCFQNQKGIPKNFVSIVRQFKV